MAHRILSRSSRPLIKAYLPNLSAAVQHFRTFCSYDSRQSQNPPIINTDSKEYTELVWPDKNLGPLASKDRRFPMPGCVGIRSKTSERATPSASSTVRAVEPFLDTAVPSRAVPQERHISVLTEYLSNVQDLDEENKYTANPSPTDTLEFLVQDCPQLLRHDFQDLFPEKPLMEGVLTVITISQKTENDMSGWSEEIEEEREDLLEHFIRGATEICESLQEAGYWADFIDPASGRPYLGPYTNATLFETDDRYRNFGFDIRDLGCCKVISHHLWGSHAYVGCMFTNAPSDHPVLTSLVIMDDE